MSATAPSIWFVSWQLSNGYNISNHLTPYLFSYQYDLITIHLEQNNRYIQSAGAIWSENPLDCDWAVSLSSHVLYLLWICGCHPVNCDGPRFIASELHSLLKWFSNVRDKIWVMLATRIAFSVSINGAGECIWIAAIDRTVLLQQSTLDKKHVDFKSSRIFVSFPIFQPISPYIHAKQNEHINILRPSLQKAFYPVC